MGTFFLIREFCMFLDISIDLHGFAMTLWCQQFHTEIDDLFVILLSSRC